MLYVYKNGDVSGDDLRRAGNGRSQREFIRCLALHNGYVINFVNADKGEMLEASRESFLCEYEAMESLFRKCLRKR